MKYLALGFLIFCLTDALANHISGGQLFYNYLGNDQYSISLHLYRDCYCTGCAPYGDPEYVSIFANNNTLYSQVPLSFPGSMPVTVIPGDSCAFPPDMCLEKAVYNSTVLLPAAGAPYTITYQRCCWLAHNNALVDQGITLESIITGSSVAVNNSPPRFTSEPPIYWLVNKPISISLAATDLNTIDSLSYSMCNVYAGASVTCPDPSPSAIGGCPSAPPPPPYPVVNYISGYDSSDFLSSPIGNELTIDSITGLLHGLPTATGMYVVGVSVKDYRNGIYLSETRKFFTLTITNCLEPSSISNNDSELFSITPNPTTDALTITADNQAPVMVSIYSATGVLMGNYQKPAAGALSIPVNNLPPAYYMLKLSDSDGLSATKGFIVVR